MPRLAKGSMHLPLPKDGMSMKALSQKDAAILALVVENPRMNEARYDSLFRLVEDCEVRQLIEVYRADQKGESPNGQAGRFMAALEAIRAWGAANEGRRVLNKEAECDLIG